jgi:eukaryotic-like serine/threonine-protein kinase
MPKQQIKLRRRVWTIDFDAPLGSPGGFGAVYCGYGVNDNAVAIKRLHLSAKAAAHRELRMAEELIDKSLPHVIDILDYGLDSESDFYFIVMPRAEGSLEDFALASGPMPESEVVSIGIQLLAGLDELGTVIHRDLKPQNVLRQGDRWKISDFGIARFVEDATSTGTLRDCISPAYAAPEQWNLEPVSKATDIYALGGILYRLLAGKLAFPANSIDDFRQHHLGATPPRAPNCSSALASLIQSMMRKPQALRPSLERIAHVLNEPVERPFSSQVVAALVAAGARLADDEERKRRIEEEKARTRRARNEIAIHASQILRDHIERLIAEIRLHVPTAQAETRPGGDIQYYKVVCESAILQLYCPTGGHALPVGLFQHSKWDVICGGGVKVSMLRPRELHRSASLWYTDLATKSGFRWYEVSYWSMSTKADPNHAPFLLNPSEAEHADIAAAAGMHPMNIATKPRPVDDENFPDFAERWMQLFAFAIDGTLTYPQVLPLD